jgi:hypothetical protein
MIVLSSSLSPPFFDTICIYIYMCVCVRVYVTHTIIPPSTSQSILGRERKRILVTGGAGFVGSHLVPPLPRWHFFFLLSSFLSIIHPSILPCISFLSSFFHPSSFVFCPVVPLPLLLGSSVLATSVSILIFFKGGINKKCESREN